MTPTSAALWSALLASALRAAFAVAAPSASCGPDSHDLPGACRLAPPRPDEVDAILHDADRILDRYAGDSTALGRQCYALGATMKAHVGDVRMIDYMWREQDPEGHLAPVTGDAHRIEIVAGSGHVHIARGYDALNPDRGLAAILQTARHEFAHLNGSPQSAGWRVDTAAELAAACGPD